MMIVVVMISVMRKNSKDDQFQKIIKGELMVIILHVFLNQHDQSDCDEKQAMANMINSK